MQIKPLILIVFAASITQIKKPNFHKQEVVATIENSQLYEVSGIEESYVNPGQFWTHNDSGYGPSIFLIDSKANITMEVELAGIKNRDWEEIVTTEEDGTSYIYIAEIGDNRAKYKALKIHRIEEPKLMSDTKVTIPKSEIVTMNFQYEEGARDAEALMFDYTTNEFVLVTKRESNALVYCFQFKPCEEPTQIKSKGTIPTRLFTAADMNTEGEILLKHYDSIYYWSSSKRSALERILEWKPSTVEYQPEPQGEAICWYKDDFYTISEKNTGKPQEMLVFRRKEN